MKPRADEFDVMVVRDGVWQRHGTYRSRQEASEAVDAIDRSKYPHVGIMPQISYFRPFYAYPLEEV